MSKILKAVGNKLKNKKISEIQVFHDIDLRFGNMCYLDINELFIMMGKDDRIKDFINSDFIKPGLRASVADRMAPSENEDVMINLECESRISLIPAVLKQEEYCKEFYKKHKRKIKPLMITTNNFKDLIFKVIWGYSDEFCSMSIIYPIALIDGDKMLNIIKNRLKNNQPLKRKHIVFLTWAAYTTYSMTSAEMIYEVSKIVNEAHLDKDLSTELKILHVQDCNRLVKNQKEKNKIFGEIDMECGALEEAKKILRKEVFDFVNEEVEKELQEKDETINKKDEIIQKLKQENQQLKKLIQ